MSVNVQLNRDGIPILVSPLESFSLVIPNVRFTVESGRYALKLDDRYYFLLRMNLLFSGYPGQGGCFYGRSGTAYVSQYRVVYIEKERPTPLFISFSIPYYAIQQWKFHRSFLGTRIWSGKLAVVPGGGLIAMGSFQLEFQKHGFESFEQQVLQHLACSRNLSNQVSSMEGPAVAMLAYPDSSINSTELNEENQQEKKIGVAYVNPEDPFRVYLSTCKE